MIPCVYTCCKITLVKAAQAAATTTIDSDSVDMTGFEGVAFVGSVAAKATNNIATVGQSSDNSTFAALAAGAAVSPTVNGNSFVIDVAKPVDRYVRVSIARGTSTATGDVYAIQYGARKEPVTHGTTIDGKLAVSPAEA